VTLVWAVSLGYRTRQSPTECVLDSACAGLIHIGRPIASHRDQIKDDEMGSACSMHGMGNSYRILVGKSEGKRLHERH
jgi:hypothetical protein